MIRVWLSIDDITDVVWLMVAKHPLCFIAYDLTPPSLLLIGLANELNDILKVAS